MAIIPDGTNLDNVVLNSTNTVAVTTTKKSFEELFAGYDTNNLLKNSGLSTTEAERVSKSVNGVTSGTVFTSDSGTRYTKDDIVMVNGVPHIVGADGSLEGLGIDVTADVSTTGSSATTATTTTTSTAVNSPTVDSRLRLSALEGREISVYGARDPNNILSPLWSTGGLMFPFTPTLQIAGEANWDSHNLTHTNFDVLSYQKTPSATIGISGRFTVQNQREGEYAIAVIHFLRSMTKMYYGDQGETQGGKAVNKGNDTTQGLPPPVLRLRGYGDYMFPDLRCVIRGYNFSFDENMDLINITLPSGGTVMLPPLFTISVNIGLQQSPKRVRKDFNLADFKTGKTMLRGGNWF